MRKPKLSITNGLHVLLPLKNKMELSVIKYHAGDYLVEIAIFDKDGKWVTAEVLNDVLSHKRFKKSTPLDTDVQIINVDDANIVIKKLGLG